MTRSRHFQAAGLAATLAANAPAGAQHTDPSSFVTIRELAARGSVHPVTSTFGEVSDRSLLEIVFEESKMALPSEDLPNIEMRIEAIVNHGTATSRRGSIDNYLTARDDGSLVYHDKPFNPHAGLSVLPDAVIDFELFGLGSGDVLTVRITNLVTQESLERRLRVRSFGFRAGVSDSLLFLKRQGVTASEREAGIDDFNFGPAPGVTYGGTYLSRGRGFLRFLRPGVGLNISFMDWDDPAFDLATGRFASGTESSDIEIGLGLQFSILGDVLQLSYGWNLQAEQDRRYFGIGVSFVSLSERLKGLIAPTETN